MVLLHAEILTRLYSMRNTVAHFGCSPDETVGLIKTLIDDIESRQEK